MKKLGINERFFDKESKEMWYALGVSFSKYSASRTDDRNSWSVNSYRLLEIVQSCLEAEQKIGTPDKNGNALFQVRNKHLQDNLRERGLGVPKSEREFPKDCGEQYLDHFVRGFFDSNVTVSTKSTGSLYTRVSYPSVQFLQELYIGLAKHAGVKPGRKINISVFDLNGTDVIAVHNFIYRDWDFIKEHGLYLPAKKEKFGL